MGFRGTRLVRMVPVVGGTKLLAQWFAALVSNLMVQDLDLATGETLGTHAECGAEPPVLVVCQMRVASALSKSLAAIAHGGRDVCTILVGGGGCQLGEGCQCWAAELSAKLCAKGRLRT
jgi:hypothetical protein